MNEAQNVWILAALLAVFGAFAWGILRATRVRQAPRRPLRISSSAPRSLTDGVQVFLPPEFNTDMRDIDGWRRHRKALRTISRFLWNEDWGVVFWQGRLMTASFSNLREDQGIEALIQPFWPELACLAREALAQSQNR